jgi:acyl-CoA synthetase (AMP-forming)/AMP-acid ligase II
MIRLLERAAGASPTHPAVLTDDASASYGELLSDARRVASALRARGIERFAIVETDAGLVIRLLAGAAIAGAEPCQYEGDIAAVEFARQAAILGHGTVVTGRNDLGESTDSIAPEQLIGEGSDTHVPAAERQPLMIRTSGTTGVPKAARHDWQRLERTVENVRPNPHQRWLLAYGPHQFAGIQVLQHVVASHATLVAPFPRQPRDGLRAIVNERVNCVSATPTYWRFLLAEARSADAQLPALEQITLGGEASPPDLLAQLQETFPAARISHVYASTEFGSVASVKDGLPGFPIESLHSESNPAGKLRVVDGELWVRAPAGMLGYAGADAESRRNDGDWWATGDLVEIAGDRVVFRGRDSEVINVGGHKVDPLPIETRITALERIAMARVFGRPNPVMGAIVAAEVVPASGVEDSEHQEIREEIKAAVADLPRAWHPRSVNFVEEIETHGSKTIRGVAR